MRLHLLFAALISLALAGCIGSEDTPVETASNDMNGQASAGAAAAQASATISNASEVDDTPPEPVVVPVSYTGAFSNSATACQSSPDSMTCTTVGGSAFDSTEPTFTGTVTSGVITMTWTAAHPKMEQLIMHIYACNDEGCQATTTKGTSPLTASFMGTKAESITLAFMTEPAQAGDVTVFVATDQTFEVEGTLTTIAR